MLGCFCLGWLLFWCWCRVFPRRLLCILVGCCVWFLLWLGRRVLASCWESFFVVGGLFRQVLLRGVWSWCVRVGFVLLFLLGLVLGGLFCRCILW